MAESTPRIIGQRDAFLNALFALFERDPSCFFVTADNGAPSLDQFFERLPRQIITVGIAEAQMAGMAAGLAIEGKKVWCYAIAPFVTARVYEQLKLDVCAHALHVTMLGVGAGFAYDIMGPSHHTVEDLSIMRALPNMRIWCPSDSASAVTLVEASHASGGPGYIRFDRTGLREIRAEGVVTAGIDVLGESDDPEVVIVSTGVGVHTALAVRDLLGFRTRVVDVVQIKPLDIRRLAGLIPPSARLVVLEEHLLAGGLGSAVLEALNDAGVPRAVLRIGVPDTYTFLYGGREAIWEKYRLTPPQVAARVTAWLSGDAQ